MDLPSFFFYPGFLLLLSTMHIVVNVSWLQFLRFSFVVVVFRRCIAYEYPLFVSLQGTMKI